MKHLKISLLKKLSMDEISTWGDTGCNPGNRCISPGLLFGLSSSRGMSDGRKKKVAKFGARA